MTKELLHNICTLFINDLMMISNKVINQKLIFSYHNIKERSMFKE